MGFGFGIQANGGLPLWLPAIGVPIFAIAVFAAKGFFQVAPNEGQVLQLFGKYAGTVRVEGLRWTNPFYSKQRISLRVRNFESGKLKVNDSDGNPIEIGAVVVWQVVDTAEAVFCVDDYENYVHIQSESALRQMAQSYPYDAHDDSKPSLRSHGDVINTHLRDEIQTRLGKAGVQVVEARISHLAYAQEIAQAMLQRQQAGAIIAARTQDRRRRGEHGRDGARPAQQARRGAARRRAQGGDGQQPAGGAVR
jgi:regulator of protease activity HflC (stomatin/prohibitin superfamily)